MRNIQFWSRETDFKIILFSLCTIAITFAGFVGMLLCDDPVSYITPAFSFAFAIFAWGVFKIIEPPFYGRVWARSKAIGIPALWLLLFISFTILFSEIAGRHEVVREEYAGDRSGTTSRA